MAFDCEVGSFVLNTSPGNQTITLADNGITPKLVWLRTTRSTSDGNYQDDAFFSLGWGDLNTEFSCGTGSADNVGTSEVTRSIQNNMLTGFDPSSQKDVVSSSAANPTVITVTGHGYSNGDKINISQHSGSDKDLEIGNTHTISNVTADTFTIPVNVGTGGTGGQIIKITEQVSLVSFNAGDFVISVDIAGVAITVEYMVWGGSDLEGVFIGNFSAPTSSGDFSVSDNPFSGERPSAVFFMTTNNSNSGSTPDKIDVNHNESAFTFGFMGTVKQNSTQTTGCKMYAGDKEATMETFSPVGTDGPCFAQYAFKSGGWALDGNFRFVSMETDGFKLNQQSGSEVPAIGYYIGYLAVKGSNWEVVEALTPTSTGTQSLVNSGFTPDGAIFTLGNANDAAMGPGWASNDGGSKPFPEGVAFQSDDDNITTSDAKRLTRVDKAFVRAFAGADTDRNAADLHTWNPDGLTLDWTTAIAAATYHVIMFGAAGTPFEAGTGTDEGMITLV